jgi:hypothetical protein
LPRDGNGDEQLPCDKASAIGDGLLSFAKTRLARKFAEKAAWHPHHLEKDLLAHREILRCNWVQGRLPGFLPGFHLSTFGGSVAAHHYRRLTDRDYPNDAYSLFHGAAIEWTA